MDNNLITVGIFGEVNSGKSTLFNKLLNQDLAIVSATAGTTTDSVSKLIELGELGRVKLIDTAGLGDSTQLAEQRIQATLKVAKTVDIAIITHISDDDGSNMLKELFDKFNTPYIDVVNVAFSNKCESYGKSALYIDFDKKEDIQTLLDELLKIKLTNKVNFTITGNLVKKGDKVILVMPQDKAAPDGRLILPQSQTIRELLDKGCKVICVTPNNIKATLDDLKSLPDLVITDSSVFDYVYQNLPRECKLSSFSVLFAKFKGDINTFIKGAEVFDKLTSDSKILIAEACSHTPKNEDIGRVKIPALIRKKFGNTVHVDIVNGLDLPTDLGEYDLIIHCGACMFSRKTVLNRILQAKEQNVPITNYGIAIAKLNGILDKIVY